MRRDLSACDERIEGVRDVRTVTSEASGWPRDLSHLVGLDTGVHQSLGLLSHEITPVGEGNQVGVDAEESDDLRREKRIAKEEGDGFG